MHVRPTTDVKRWDAWLIAQTRYTPFAQSAAWGDILITEGRKQVERLEVWDEKQCVAQAQCVFTDLPFGMRYAFSAKGPVISTEEGIRKKEQMIYEALSEYLKQQRCIFFRIEPDQLVKSLPLTIEKTIDIQPRATIRLDLSQTSDELIKAMHHKARYNIRLSEKKGVVVQEGKNLEHFLRLYHETGKRDAFALHDDERYQVVLESTGAVHQLSAVFENKIVATGIFLGFGNVFYYLYGASDYYFRHVMGPYAVQWAAIELGKKLGYKYYDFYGIAPPPGEPAATMNGHYESNFSGVEGYIYNEHHQHANLARFKLGFGGEIEVNIGTWDIIIDKRRYMVYKLIRAIRRFI